VKRAEIKRQKANIKRQKGGTLFFFFLRLQRSCLKSELKEIALLPNELLPFAFCYLPFDLHF
jgi:hypothetical protein